MSEIGGMVKILDYCFCFLLEYWKSVSAFKVFGIRAYFSLWEVLDHFMSALDCFLCHILDQKKKDISEEGSQTLFLFCILILLI